MTKDLDAPDGHVSPPQEPSPAQGRQGSVEAQLRDWGIKLDRFLEQSERSVAIGRELVEQRALNIDLQRQIHRLEGELLSLRAASGSADTAPGQGSLRDADTGPSGGAGGLRQQRPQSAFRRLIQKLAGLS